MALLLKPVDSSASRTGALDSGGGCGGDTATAKTNPAEISPPWSGQKRGGVLSRARSGLSSTVRSLGYRTLPSFCSSSSPSSYSVLSSAALKIGYRAASSVSDVASSVSDAAERGKRAYWDDLAPPFGIPGVADVNMNANANANATARNIGGDSPERGGNYRGREVKKRRILRRILKKRANGATEERWEEEPSSLLPEDEEDGGAEAVGAGNMTTATTIHFCFLVHGYNGKSADLW